MPTESQNEVPQVEAQFLIIQHFIHYNNLLTTLQEIVQVKTLIPTNGDPHAFELGPKTIVDLSKSFDMLVYNGVDFEPYIDEIKSSPDFAHLILVDSSEGITFLEGEKHDHGAHGGHEEHDEHTEEFLVKLHIQ